MAQKSQSGFQISWTTITYRSVVLAILVIALMVGTIWYFLFPAQAQSAASKAGAWLESMGVKMGLISPSGNGKAAAGAQQAQFTNIDGTVRVKKANSNSWITADITTVLDRGDVVQTGSEGLAKVVFSDGTNYTIKPDSLIVIEEHTRNESAQTRVAVQVTTGTVDLATATHTAGSKSQVIVAGATASLDPDSAAQVRNDVRNDRQEILVKKGSGEIQRGTETVRLGNYEKVSFQSASTAAMQKEREIGPPTLINPANMAPLFQANATMPVSFNWTEVANSRSYRVRVSRNPYFSSVVLDKKVDEPGLKVSGLQEGAYYWAVQAVDDKGRESIESERNRFTIIAKAAQSAAIPLELEPFVQHGHVIQLRGRTEPGARVMVNGQEVALVRPDGSFEFFTPKLPNGENVITVTAQNAKGGVNTQQRKIVIQ